MSVSVYSGCFKQKKGNIISKPTHADSPEKSFFKIEVH